jgi:hypothetical protein
LTNSDDEWRWNSSSAQMYSERCWLDLAVDGGGEPATKMYGGARLRLHGTRWHFAMKQVENRQVLLSSGEIGR